MTEEETSNTSAPAWLKNLQENSWELELLISGGAIFTLFQVSDWFIEFVVSLLTTNPFPGITQFLILGMLGIKLLTIGFVLHLLLRAIWLGLVCINYVFPAGIKESKLILKKPFKEKLSKGGNLFAEIERMDRAAGLVMFFSIASTLVITGAILFLLIMVTIPTLIVNPPPIYLKLVMGSMLLYYIDFFSFGLLRKTKIISLIVYPFFYLFDLITLRFTFSKALRLFNSNISHTQAAIATVLLASVSFFFTYTSIYPIMHWPNIIDSREHRHDITEAGYYMNSAYYLDEIRRTEGADFSGPSIESQVVTGNFLKVFMPYNKAYDEFVIPGSKLSESVSVYINDSLCEKVDWYTWWPKSNDELGMVTRLDIVAVPRGSHRLILENKLSGEQIHIPFWRDK